MCSTKALKTHRYIVISRTGCPPDTASQQTPCSYPDPGDILIPCVIADDSIYPKDF